MKIFSALLSAALSLSLNAAPQPVAHWKLDEGAGATVKDSGELKLHGTLVNEQNTRWGEGRGGGKALYFVGDPDKKRKGGCVLIPRINGLALDKPFTVSCWFKCENRQLMPRQGMYEIFSNAVGEHGPGFRLAVSWETLVFLSEPGGGVKGARLSAPPAKFPVEREVWHHAAAVWDGKTFRLYLNGVAAAEQDGLNHIGRKGFNIGGYNNGYGYGFVGAIADVKFFQQALTDAEVMGEAKELVTD